MLMMFDGVKNPRFMRLLKLDKKKTIVLDPQRIGMWVTCRQISSFNFISSRLLHMLFKACHASEANLL